MAPIQRECQLHPHNLFHHWHHSCNNKLTMSRNHDLPQCYVQPRFHHKLSNIEKNVDFQQLTSVAHNITSTTGSPFVYPMALHIYNSSTGKRETIDTLQAPPNGCIWERALSNKWGRLTLGNKHRVAHTVDLYTLSKKVTYLQALCTFKSTKGCIV